MSDKYCKLCGYTFQDDNLEESIETHLREDHFIDYKDYYELVVTGNPSEKCWKCGSNRYIITPWLDQFHLPCTDCINYDNRVSMVEMQNEIISVTKNFQRSISKNRFYQYVLSLDSKQRQKFLPKNIESISDNLNTLKKMGKYKIDKSQLFYIKNITGTSSEISQRNINNLYMEFIDFEVTQEDDGRFCLGNTGYYISLPQSVEFDSRHHSRNSILNPAAKRSSKRLRIGDNGDCIRFYYTPNPTSRCILQLTDKNNKQIEYTELSDYTKWIIRSCILRTKEIRTRVFEIYNEIFKYISWIKDSVFLSNSISIPINTDIGMIFTWSWSEQNTEELGGEVIKLSIL